MATRWTEAFRTKQIPDDPMILYYLKIHTGRKETWWTRFKDWWRAWRSKNETTIAAVCLSSIVLAIVITTLQVMR